MPSYYYSFGVILYIEIAGYHIYPGFLILLVVLAAIFVIAKKLLVKIEGESEIYDSIKITDWQKFNLVSILEDTKENITDDENLALVNNMIQYIETHHVWDRDYIMQFDSSAMVIFSTIFTVAAREAYFNNDSNKAVLLMHTVDAMNNGQYLLKEVDEWIGSDVEMFGSDVNLTLSESRMYTILESSVYAMEDHINELGLNNPNLPDYIKIATSEKIEMSLEDIYNFRNFIELNNEAYDILTRAMFYAVEGMLRGLSEDDYLKEYNLYLIRVLASTMDKELYDYIVKTIV